VQTETAKPPYFYAPIVDQRTRHFFHDHFDSHFDIAGRQLVLPRSDAFYQIRFGQWHTTTARFACNPISDPRCPFAP
jgi:hypothetical protein